MKFAQPKCPKCEKGTFAVTVIEPVESKFKAVAVHCNSCGAVVGVQDYYNINSRLEKLAEKLGVRLD